MNLREQIDNAKGTMEPFPAPEWGIPKGLFLRVMGEDEAVLMFAEQEEAKKQGERYINARVAVRVLCDEGGDRIYQDGDIDKLAKKGVDVLRRIVHRALEMHGYTEEAAEALEGNSEATQGTDSDSS